MNLMKCEPKADGHALRIDKALALHLVNSYIDARADPRAGWQTPRCEIQFTESKELSFILNLGWDRGTIARLQALNMTGDAAKAVDKVLGTVVKNVKDSK